MSRTLTNINCEITSMEMYMALPATSSQTAGNSNWKSTIISNWEFQVSRSYVWSLYTLYMTHGNGKLEDDCDEDEIYSAQNEISGERIGEHAFPSICFLELGSPV